MEMVTADLSRAGRLLITSLARPALARVGFAIVFIILGGILAAAPAALIGRAVDQVVAERSIWAASIADTIVLLITALGTYELVQVCRKFLIEDVAVRLQARAQLQFADALLTVPVDSLHRKHIGEIITLIDKGVTGLVRLMKLLFLEFGPALATSLVAVAVVLGVHPAVAGVMIVVLATNAIITIWQIRSQRGIRINLLERRAEFNGQVGELLINLDSVRASGLTKIEQAEFRNVAEAIRGTEFRHHRAMMTFDAFKGLSDGGGLVVVLIVALVLFSTSDISPGDILKIALLYQNAVVPLRMLHRVVDESHEAAIHVTRAAALSEIGADPGLSGTDPITDMDACANAFEATNLSFGFATGERRVLDDISYVVSKTTLDIILGETGSGKTSLLRIMLGLHADYQGQAKVFGTEVRTADKDELSRHVCYVAQDPFVKAGSLRSNLQLGLHRVASDEELVRAALLAGLPLGVGGWVDGLDHPIAERGKGLSGGERQRIALARMFLSDAELFVLDEATSQLDEPMEDFVLANLAKACRSKAVVMVAHRSTTRKWAKRTFELRKGKLVLVPSAALLGLNPFTDAA